MMAPLFLLRMLDANAVENVSTTQDPPAGMPTKLQPKALEGPQQPALISRIKQLLLSTDEPSASQMHTLLTKDAPNTLRALFHILHQERDDAKTVFAVFSVLKSLKAPMNASLWSQYFTIDNQKHGCLESLLQRLLQHHMEEQAAQHIAHFASSLDSISSGSDNEAALLFNTLEHSSCMLLLAQQH
jgi:hypothetical protein